MAIVASLTGGITWLFWPDPTPEDLIARFDADPTEANARVMLERLKWGRVETEPGNQILHRLLQPADPTPVRLTIGDEFTPKVSYRFPITWPDAAFLNYAVRSVTISGPTGDRMIGYMEKDTPISEIRSFDDEPNVAPVRIAAPGRHRVKVAFAVNCTITYSSIQQPSSTGERLWRRVKRLFVEPETPPEANQHWLEWPATAYATELEAEFILDVTDPNAQPDREDTDR